MNCRSGSDGGFFHGEFEARVRWRVRRELHNMSAIAASAWVALLTVEAVTIYLFAV